jgi:tRNA(adenine34) deaminase
MIQGFDDNYFMSKALEQAQLAFEKDEVPVGAVVVIDQRIIAKSHNLTELLNDVTAHAEMQAITAAANFLGGKYLKGCTLYVTLEPCQMCAGALYWSQIDRLVFGAADVKRGFQSLGTLLHPKTQVTGGVMAETCGQLMLDFFGRKRG